MSGTVCVRYTRCMLQGVYGTQGVCYRSCPGHAVYAIATSGITFGITNGHTFLGTVSEYPQRAAGSLRLGGPLHNETIKYIMFTTLGLRFTIR